MSVMIQFIRPIDQMECSVLESTEHGRKKYSSAISHCAMLPEAHDGDDIIRLSKCGGLPNTDIEVMILLSSVSIETLH